MRFRNSEEITHIIIHMSDSEDGPGFNASAIYKYHTSYRYNFRTINKNLAKKLESEGKKVEHPWPDVGYHFLIDNVDGNYYPVIGRSVFQTAAACWQQGMNVHGIHVCFIGDYDIKRPPQKMLEVAVKKVIIPCIRAFNITVENIQPHSAYANKTCPGRMFDMSELRNMTRMELIKEIHENDS